MEHEEEPVETIYLDEKQIEEFLEQYKRENPDAQFETRFVKAPVQHIEQEVSVKYLRPTTPPEPAPIIIREERAQAPEEAPPIRIVQVHNEARRHTPEPPLVIREQPPAFPSASQEPKVIYVKKQTKD